jgi:hypothetical protein
MKRTLTGLLCRILIVTMAWMPFQLAQAGMIGTDQAVAAVTQLDRAAVVSFINRADVARDLQAYGVDLSSAKDRVASLTDDEVRTLLGKMHSAPVGADGSTVAWLILIGVVLWFVFWKK